MLSAFDFALLFLIVMCGVGWPLALIASRIQEHTQMIERLNEEWSDE